MADNYTEHPHTLSNSWFVSTGRFFAADETLKKQASDVFEALGMSLSVAINLFLKQAVEKQMFPCSLELNVTKDMTATYPVGFVFPFVSFSK